MRSKGGPAARPRRDDAVTTLSAELSTGRAAVSVFSSVMPPEELFGFAERRNPKRAFLFVSRVLGRHIPVRPSVMRRTYRMLARQMPDKLPGPVVVIGMAETAVGLGAGVHDTLTTADGANSLYLPSTRHPMGGPILARFREEHSHASHHMIHVPTDPDHRALLFDARTLVLVDDEVTSGKTFRNLAQALGDAGLRPETVVCTCLTDWSDRRIAEVVGEVFPDARIARAFLSEGRYSWTPSGTHPPLPMPVGDVAEAGVYPLDPARDWGRLGVTCNRPMLCADARPGRRTLVLGTSEFVWQPFLLAERLERQGEDVRFGAVTRSPARQGHAIERTLAFRDNYGLGLPNYLYNVDRAAYDRVVLCVETPPCSVDPALAAALTPEIVTTAAG